METCYTIVSAVRLLIAHYNLVSLRKCKGIFYYDDPFPGWEDEDDDDE